MAAFGRSFSRSACASGHGVRDGLRQALDIRQKRQAAGPKRVLGRGSDNDAGKAAANENRRTRDVTQGLNCRIAVEVETRRPSSL